MTCFSALNRLLTMRVRCVYYLTKLWTKTKIVGNLVQNCRRYIIHNLPAFCWAISSSTDKYVAYVCSNRQLLLNWR